MVENGYTNHLTLVVAGGNYTYIVGDPSDSSLLVVMETSFSDQYYLETGINAQFALLNDGTADFDDSLYAWFINASDSSKQIGLKWKDGILIPAGESALLDLSADLAGSGFTAGYWYFGILDGDYNQLTDWTLFTVAEGRDPLYSAKSSVASISFAIPEYVYEDYVLDLASGVLFTSNSDSDLSIGFSIYKKGEADPCVATILGSLPAATMSAIKGNTILLGGFPSVAFNTSTSVQIGSMDLDLGEYEFAFVDNTLALLSPRYPFSYAAKCDGILYASADDGNVMAVGLLEESDHLEIPASVEIKGKLYCVAGLGDNLFLRNKNVGVVKLPPTISTLGRNTFSYAGMSSVYFWSDEVPTLHPQYSFGGINPDVNFHVPYRAYDSYVRALENYGNVISLYDLNTDYDENIADVTYLGEEVMGDTGENYDLNGDERTNVGDMTWLVNHLLGGGSSEAGALNMAPRDNNTQLLELGFDNYDDCIAIQADAEVNGISDNIRICLADALSKTHALAWSFLDDSHIRILIYSIYNAPFSIADGTAAFSIESGVGLELRDMNAVAVGRPHQCRQLNSAVCSTATPKSATVVVKTEYFDLQGIPIDNPEGLHIVKKNILKWLHIHSETD